MLPGIDHVVSVVGCFSLFALLETCRPAPKYFTRKCVLTYEFLTLAWLVSSQFNLDYPI